MERLRKIIFSILFIVGFVGAVTSAGANKESQNQLSILREIQDVNEANLINSGKWTMEDAARSGLDTETLNHIEKLFQAEDTVKTVSK